MARSVQDPALKALRSLATLLAWPPVQGERHRKGVVAAVRRRHGQLLDIRKEMATNQSSRSRRIGQRSGTIVPPSTATDLIGGHVRKPPLTGLCRHCPLIGRSVCRSLSPTQQRTEAIMIEDKVVIITCASSGIGEASAKLLASKGAKGVLGARRGEELKRIVEEIEADGGQAVYQELDVTDPSANDAMVELAKIEFGGVDVVFLNAGLMPNSPLSELETDDWHQTVDVNIKGV